MRAPGPAARLHHAHALDKQCAAGSSAYLRASRLPAGQPGIAPQLWPRSDWRNLGAGVVADEGRRTNDQGRYSFGGRRTKDERPRKILIRRTKDEGRTTKEDTHSSVVGRR